MSRMYTTCCTIFVGVHQCTAIYDLLIRLHWKRANWIFSSFCMYPLMCSLFTQHPIKLNDKANWERYRSCFGQMNWQRGCLHISHRCCSNAIDPICRCWLCKWSNYYSHSPRNYEMDTDCVTARFSHLLQLLNSLSLTITFEIGPGLAFLLFSKYTFDHIRIIME